MDHTFDEYGLLGIAYTDLQFAKFGLKNPPSFRYLNGSAGHVQQAVEKILKEVITLDGKRYTFTHNIEQLCDLCKNSRFKVPDIITLNARTITSWAVDARYPSFLIVIPDELTKILSATEAWLSELLQELGLTIDDLQKDGRESEHTTEFNNKE